MVKETLVLAIAIFISLYQDANAMNSLTGEFKYENRMCKWMEKPGTGKGPRTLKVNCPTTKDVKKAVGCEYRGNPHHCPEYNNKGQRRFYQCLADTLGKMTGDLCNINTVICNNMCDDIVFYLDKYTTEKNTTDTTEKNTIKEGGSQTYIYVLVGIAGVASIFSLVYFFK